MGNGRPGPQRWLDVGPERIEAWLASFTARHGQTGLTIDDRREVVLARAAEGGSAECHVPFPPLAARLRGTGADLAAHAGADRTVGVLLVRLGGYAAGVFAGSAPRLVAKGVDLVAQNIRRIAEEHRVPVFEAPKLARALYRSTDLNKEIPSGLYVAVAQVLSYIFRVRTLNPTLAARLARPDPVVGGEFEDA